MVADEPLYATYNMHVEATESRGALPDSQKLKKRKRSSSSSSSKASLVSSASVSAADLLEIPGSSPLKKHKKEKSSSSSSSKSSKDKKKEKKKEKEKKKKKQKSSSGEKSKKRRKQILPPHKLRFVVAPMVGGSELAFRMLCRKYGATLAYTPMMSATKFAHDAEYRKAELQTHPTDRPLVAHFNANNAKDLLSAAKLAAPHVDAIDLNLGCPQRIAHSGHFGSFLLGDEDRELVLGIVRTVAKGVAPLPVFCKIRLLDSTAATVKLCEQLRDAGARLIAVHARHRVQYDGKTGRAVSRQGAAHLAEVAAVKSALGDDFPILSNGNTRTWVDVEANLASTRADGVMSAEGLLDDPALFAPGENKPDACSLALEYLDLVAKHPVKHSTVLFHLRRMLRNPLTKFQLTEEMMSAKNLEEARSLAHRLAGYARGDMEFTYDAERAKREREAAARRKAELGRRRDYEARMRRKAAREGKPMDYYLEQGASPPTLAQLEEARSLPEEKRLGWWKGRFSQHCFAYHLQAGGCQRERACAFLHADPSNAGASEPSWLEEKP